MTNKGKHISKKHFGSRIDDRMHKLDSRKMNRVSFERDDIEIPDDIELPKEHEIPQLSNSSSKKAIQPKDMNDENGIDLEDESNDTHDVDNASDMPMKQKARHAKNFNSENEDDTSNDDDSDALPKTAKHSEKNILAQHGKKADAEGDASEGSSKTEPYDENNESLNAHAAENHDLPDASDTLITDTYNEDESDGSQYPQTDAASEAKGFDIKKERFFERHPKAKKRILITCGSIVGVLAAIYFIGVAFFTFFMYPNSNIDKIDTSIKTPVPIQEELRSMIEDYSFTVKGQGMDTKLTSKDIGMSVDYESATQNALNSQNAWLWPYEIFITHDNTHYLKDAISMNLLADALTAEVDSINASAVHPTNAFIQFVVEENTFTIVPEVPGSILDPQKVIDKTSECVLNFDTSIMLGHETLLEPTVLSDDERLLKALDEAIALLSVNPQLSLNGNSVYTIDPSIIGPWVIVDENFSIALNPELMAAWSEEMSQQFNTVGKARTYTRADGKVVNVKGGTYGWKVDLANLVSLVNEAFAARTSSVIEIPVSQSGTGYDAASGRDWGARYVDVDIAEQYARFYDANGAIIWESPIVSGAEGKTDTPTGVYTLNRKGTNVTLRGPMKDGEYEWESKVKYWMPFKGNSVGLHDASWQSAFGGSRFRQGFGSHGCVNLPSDKARALYDMIQQGDVVVVHY